MKRYFKSLVFVFQAHPVKYLRVTLDMGLILETQMLQLITMAIKWIRPHRSLGRKDLMVGHLRVTSQVQVYPVVRQVTLQACVYQVRFVHHHHRKLWLRLGFLQTLWFLIWCLYYCHSGLIHVSAFKGRTYTGRTAEV